MSNPSDKLPPVTQQPILHVDATPDADYPARILRAHLANTYVMWRMEGVPVDQRTICDLMNEDNLKRRELLEAAIVKLEGGSSGVRAGTADAIPAKCLG